MNLRQLFRSSRADDLRRALVEARESARRWKARAADLEAREGELSGKLAALTARVEDARARIAEQRREIPMPAVVRGTFRHRVGTLAARAAVAPAAVREAQLLSVSASYRECAVSGPAVLGAQVHRMALDGLNWWVPVKTPAAGPSEAWLAGQRFPYHGIVQTRDLTIGGVMLDLGANIGRMAIPRAVLGDITSAYCAEPDPVSFACLTGNIVDNGLRGVVLPDRTAIGDREGIVRLRQVGSSGGFHVVPDTAETTQTIEVPCTTLDRWVERLAIDLDAVTFVKVDVEGFERRVVAGATRVLSHRHIAWQMEIKPAGLCGAGDEPAALYRDLAAHFTHFIDLNRKAAGSRERPVGELADAMRYIEPDGKTDILLYNGVI